MFPLSLKKQLRSRCPTVYQALASIRFFLRCRRVYGDIQKIVHEVVFAKGPIVVLNGPFKGMKYYNKTIWGTITSKWLGFYEEELNSVMEEIIRKKYPLIVDIGAAEGYYAMGLALKLPESHVITFDIDPIARFRQRELAALNGITNVDIRKLFDASSLDTLPNQKTLLICDVEGYEVELLRPETSDRFRTCDILVEIHRTEELAIPEVDHLIVDRFSSSHEILRYERTERNIETAREQVPKLKLLTDDQLIFALDEGRYPGQVWLWMRPKQSI